MSDGVIGLIIFISIILILLAGIIFAITSKSGTKRSGSYASMAAFHDMQNGEKQNAIECVIEQHAEKKWKETESGEGKEKENSK
jgi:hypothetical protein